MTATTTTRTTVITMPKTMRTRDEYAILGQGMRMMRDKAMLDEDGGQGRGQ